MKNYKRTLRSVLCALVAAAALASSFPAYAVSQSEIDELQKKLDALEQQAQEQQDIINDLTDQKARFITRKLALDNKIEINRQMIELIGEQVDISILTTMLVIKLGVPQVIAKAASEVHGEVLKHLGATVVYPEADMAVRIGKRLISGNLLDYIALDDGVEVRRIAVGGKLLGRTIRELDVRKVYGINIIAVERGHRTDVEFSADYRFEEGDTVSVVGKVEKIGRFERAIQE